MVFEYSSVCKESKGINSNYDYDGLFGLRGCSLVVILVYCLILFIYNFFPPDSEHDVSKAII